MMGVFAEIEKGLISERVKSGLDNAKNKGRKLGRPALTLDKLPNMFFKYYDDYKSGKMKFNEFQRLCEVSKNTMYKYINLMESKK